MSIQIRKNVLADIQTYDYSTVSKETLAVSSQQHIRDVQQALAFFIELLSRAGIHHDTDKLTDIDGFHSDFRTGFEKKDWWNRHRKLNRHHLSEADGIPADVTLIDVLDYIADCVMAGMARRGSVYALVLPPELLETAFQNTVSLLTEQVVVDDDSVDA